MVAVVLAAGDGTRMLSQIPKVLHGLYGKPLIGHVLDAIRGAGVRRVVAVVGYRSTLVRDQLGRAPGLTQTPGGSFGALAVKTQTSHISRAMKAGVVSG